MAPVVSGFQQLHGQRSFGSDSSGSGRSQPTTQQLPPLHVNVAGSQGGGLGPRSSSGLQVRRGCTVAASNHGIHMLMPQSMQGIYTLIKSTSFSYSWCCAEMCKCGFWALVTSLSFDGAINCIGQLIQQHCLYSAVCMRVHMRACAIAGSCVPICM